MSSVRRHAWPLGVTALVAALALGSLVAVLLFRSSDLRRFEALSVTTCQQVEELKALQRQEARETYRHLDRNLRLLGIEKTPELVRVAREQRDARLRRFAKGDC